jgi:hypothetical protein
MNTDMENLLKTTKGKNDDNGNESKSKELRWFKISEGEKK